MLILVTFGCFGTVRSYCGGKTNKDVYQNEHTPAKHIRCHQNCALGTVIFEFSLNVLLNSLNSVTKIFVITLKGIEPATQPPFV